MNLLVTGGTGFIGKHLVAELLKRGHKVLLLSRSNKQIKGTRTIVGDITKKESLTSLQKEKIDVVLHLAAEGSVTALSKESYQRFRKLNVEGTKNLLDNCKHIKKFIYFSSIAAMGVILNKELTEKTPCQPSIPYEKSKCEAEKVVISWSKTTKIPFTILRPPMVYGENPKESEMLSICRLIKKGMFPIFGNGKNLMTLTYVKNIIQGTVLALEKKKSNNQIYILTDEKSYPLRYVASTIGKELGVKKSAIFIPKIIGQIAALLLEILAKLTNTTPKLTRKRIESMTNDRIYSIKKAQTELGYKPIGLEEGIKNTITYYKKHKLL